MFTIFLVGFVEEARGTYVRPWGIQIGDWTAERPGATVQSETFMISISDLKAGFFVVIDFLVAFLCWADEFCKNEFNLTFYYAMATIYSIYIIFLQSC